MIISDKLFVSLTECAGVRYMFVVAGFLGMSIMYALRVNMSIAIIAMVNMTAVNPHLDNLTHEPMCAVFNPPLETSHMEFAQVHLYSPKKWEFRTICQLATCDDRHPSKGLPNLHHHYSFNQKAVVGRAGLCDLSHVHMLRLCCNTICQLATCDDRRPRTGLGLPPYAIIAHAVEKRQSVKPVCAINGEFFWTPKLQGVIIGSFYYGYSISQVPGARLAEIYSGKWIFGLGTVISAVLSLLIPIAAYFHIVALIFIRALQGLAQGVTFPAMYNLLGRWIREEEKTLVEAIVISGINIGTVIGMPLAAKLSNSDVFGGWPSAFYVIGKGHRERNHAKVKRSEAVKVTRG
ncbi:putative inorganic phosphate cotransporter [Trichonephila clavipes]|nr:putative inorganic phosphate cotransporter [Trichonephila clavipes]